MKRNIIIFSVLLLLVSTISINLIQAQGNSDAYHFGFKKGKNGELASIAQEGFLDIIKQYNSIFLGDTKEKELYLTFDNGYENGYTGKILDILKEKKVPAIFFVTGHYVKTEPELLIRMATEGHLIGNHSWSHPDMTRVSTQNIAKELNTVRDEVFKITGQLEMNYMRPPRGIFNEQTLSESKKLGYTNVFWSIAYMDWITNQQKGWKHAYNKVMSQLHPGAVILLHTVSKDNTDALAKIIEDARKQGYKFKSLDQMKTRSYN